jgi:GDP-L-fucose synthase
MFINIFKVISEVNPNILLINPLANCSYPGETLDILEESNWWEGIVHKSVESYGNTKKIGFILSECYKKQYGINTINLLVPNAYGPFDYTDEERTHAMNGIILRLIKAKRNNDKNFIIWGTGTPIREWIYMEDTARIIKHIVDNNLFNLPNPINLGQEQGVSITESVKMVQEVLDMNLNIDYDSSKIDGAPKKIMSNKLFKQFFPDFNFTEIKEGIEKTIQYYENII